MAYLFEVMSKKLEACPHGAFRPNFLVWQTQAYYLSEKIDTKILHEIFVDPFSQKGLESPALVADHLQTNFPKANMVMSIGFKAGVTDNTSTSAQDALKLFGIHAQVASLTRYYLKAESGQKKQLETLAQEFLYNDLIQTFSFQSLDDRSYQERFENVKIPQVELKNSPKLVELIDFGLPLEELMRLNELNCWALNESEILFLKKTFTSSSWLERRKHKNLPALPTDVEVEVIAQSWSEHCKHKIFSAQIDYSEEKNCDKPLGEKTIHGLYPQYIKKSTYQLKEQGIDWPISVFKDNAGIVRLDDKVDLCLKVETHNSPSALDPYGGALTGILGVNRDILGTGLGARPIANLDVFCLAPPSWPEVGKEEYMPQGLKTPKRLLEGVHKGVEDGGNKSGIPTVGGAIVFDQDYAGKPLVFVGTLGVMPQTLPSGLSTTFKQTKCGDKIVVVGGAVGADGIHGATFSSLELNENSPATAVQIGDPLTQKRVLDFLLKARDLELFTGLTDNGAGGLSSSLGEMATITGGASFDLSLCPLKYPHLKPFEIMISESQERMSFSVDPKKCQDFLTLAQEFGVSASVLGEFTDSGYLEVKYEDEVVADLNLEFLHDSLPPMKLKAHWQGARVRDEWMPLEDKKTFDENQTSAYKEALLQLLSSPNIASKERWVRQYDHEVQGATAIKPFQGKNQEGPSDGTAIWLGAHGGEERGAVCLAVGLAPRLSLVDPYLMAQVSVDETLRNLVCAGADPSRVALLDNFCWPDPVETSKNPDGSRKCAELVRACAGLYQAVMTYQTPLISGKDSMKNDFRGKNKKGETLQISILPTLLVTGMGHTSLDHLLPSVFQSSGDVIYCLGLQQKGLLCSEFAQIYQTSLSEIFDIDLETNHQLYKLFYQINQQKLIQSAHDLSDGGLLCALSECAIGAMLGFDITVPKDADYLFNEAPGRVLVTVKPQHAAEFETFFQDQRLIKKLGYVSAHEQVVLHFEHEKDGPLTIDLQQIRQSFLKEF